MSLIQYQRATYAGHLRDQLALAGCDAKVAALVARAVGELIDHVAHAESQVRLEVIAEAGEVGAFKRDLFDRFMGVTVLVLVVAAVSGVLIALFR